MNSSRSTFRVAVLFTGLLIFNIALQVATVSAGESDQQHLQFLRPSQAPLDSRADQGDLNFRSPSEKQQAQSQRARKKATKVAQVNYDQAVPLSKAKQTTSSEAAPRATTSASKRNVRIVRRKTKVKQDQRLVPAADEEIEVIPTPQPEPFQEYPMEEYPMEYSGGGPCMGGCACEVSCGIGEPGCGICSPGCGFEEPGCGICAPGCGFEEPGCGCADPTCGGGVGCGSCVGRPGPDYWCFPVCLPRFKDLSFWGGVHGFRGPRDFTGGESNSNFGFHEGLNISGRAPLVGLLFPQLSYQLGYQMAHSRLSGTVTSPEDRTQQFVTAGFFRRVKAGLQFGVVWDLMRDDLDMVEVDYHQIRTEFSLKSPRGREFGFWSATSTNDNLMLGIPYQTVDQYALFYRWNFGKNYECRLWGGVSGDDEGIFGGEFYAPLSDRWLVQSAFNYLIPEEDAGPLGVQQEAWNIGINLVWHMGRTARRGCNSPYRPLFPVANNGWMILDSAN